MTSAELHAARKRLGWTLETMADALRLAGSVETATNRIRELESGTRNISGPIAVAVEAFLAGFRPTHMR